MADGKVQIDFSSSDQALVAAWERQNREVDKLTGKIHKLEHASKSGNSGMLADLKSVALGWISIQAGANLATDAVRAAITAHLDLKKARDAVALTVDEARARFTNQAQLSGKSPEQLDALSKRIEQIGVQAGIKPEEAIGLGTELFSQGVAPDEIAAAIQESVKFAAAQTTTLDKDMLKALVGQVRANDPKLGAETFRETAESFFGAFLGDQIQPQQLEQFSKVNPALAAAGLSQQEQIAANVQGLNVLSGDAAQAATLLKAIVNKLQAPTPAGQQALTSMGLAPTDVDLIGESFGDVLSRIRDGLQTLPEEQRVPVVTQMFGQEYGGYAATFIGGADQFAAILARIGAGAERLDESAARWLGTAGAGARRGEAGEESAQAAGGQGIIAALEKEFDATIEREGLRVFSRWAAQAQFNINRLGSDDPEWLLRRSADAIGSQLGFSGLSGEAETKRIEAEMRANLFGDSVREALDIPPQDVLSGGEGGDTLVGSAPRPLTADSQSLAEIKMLLGKIAGGIDALIATTGEPKGVQDVRVIDDERAAGARRRSQHPLPMRGLPIGASR